MKRRDFILLSSAGIAAVGLPAYYYFGNIEYDPLTATPSSLSLIWDDAAIADAGRKYLVQVPSESGVRKLVGLLAVENQQTGDALRSMLETKIKQDFEAGDTVLVDGWLLSATEARQCALYALRETK